MIKAKTKSASPKRSSPAEIKKLYEDIKGQHFITQILSSIPEDILILNINRQIVYGNDSLLDTVALPIDQVLGKRIGELFHCIHAHEERLGCGTTDFCKECGGESILAAQKGEKNWRECRMTVKDGNNERALDLKVWSIPLKIGK
ncbi:histidine kinase, partial [Candidatus Auribacterota bacterium]